MIRQVKSLSHQLAQRSANTLARAFQHDPLFVHALPNALQRMRRLPAFFGLCVRYAEQYGEIYTDPGQNGVALWLPPGGSTVTSWRALLAGMWLTPLKVGLGAVFRLGNLQPLAERIHKRFAPGPHWYLFLLGVDPASQGQGLGGLLLRPALQRADQAHLPCYLETNNPAALPFYQKHAFSIVAEQHAKGSGPGLWAMRREA